MTEEPYRLLITGGRDASDSSEVLYRVKRHLDDAGLYRGYRPIVIVHGGCPSGVDAIVEFWVQSMRPTETTTEVHLAEEHGNWPSCGPIRNSHMVKLGADACLALPTPGSKGTWDCAKKAAQASIPTWLYTVKGGNGWRYVTQSVPWLGR